MAPGIAATNIMHTDAGGIDQFAADKPFVGRAGRSDEAAELVAFLASGEGSFVTGNISVIDDGSSLKVESVAYLKGGFSKAYNI